MIANMAFVIGWIAIMFMSVSESFDLPIALGLREEMPSSAELINAYAFGFLMILMGIFFKISERKKDD